MNRLHITSVLLVALALSGCIDQSADHKAAVLTKETATTAFNTVGLPKIKNFTELRNAKFLMELRDQADLPTYSYVRDMNGQLHHMCDSIGYGMPASVQITSPLVPWEDATGNLALPQREGNQLFMPEGLDSTYVMCVYKGKMRVMYVEEKVHTSPFKLRAVDSDIIGYDVNAK